jgi:hypothetical protein
MRVFFAHDLTVGVVVQDRESWPPEQADLRLRRKHDADCAFQRLRPALDRAKRRLRPVYRAHQTGDFAAADE